MQVVFRRCAGLDVHKDSLTATIFVFPEERESGGSHKRVSQLLESSAAAGAVATQFLSGVLGDGVDRPPLQAGVERFGEEVAIGALQSVLDQEYPDPENGPAGQHVNRRFIGA